MTSGPSDPEIVQGYLTGDLAACRFVDNCIEQTIRSWRDRLGYQMPDVVSDVRYELLMALRGKEFAYRGSLKAFISVIARHTCLDYYRAGKRIDKVDIEKLGLVDPSSSAEDRLIDHEKAFFLFRVLRMLPRECITMWRMVLKDGLSCREIGQKLGNKSDVNIRGRLLNCRKKAQEIRDQLSKGSNFSEDSSPYC